VDPDTVLRFLADLAVRADAAPHPLLPAGAAPETLDVTRTERPEWLGVTVVMPLLAGSPFEPHEAVDGTLPTRVVTRPATPGLRRLAALDALQPTERVLRLGWVTVTGTVIAGDRPMPVCLPLISQPVRAFSALNRIAVLALGPPELTPLVVDEHQAARLEAEAAYGGGAFTAGAKLSPGLLALLPHLQAWVRKVAKAAGLPPLQAVLTPDCDPLDHRSGERLVACIGTLLYVSRDLFRPRLDVALRSWAGRPGIERTAFARLYDGAGGEVERGDDGTPVASPLVLSPTQRSAVLAARRDPVTVIAGPPGSGKSHTVAAIAADAVAAGRSVLIATRSAHAAGVVADLLDRQPGPDPVLFAGADADDITERAARPGAGRAAVRAAEAAVVEAGEHQRLVEGAVTAALERERRAEASGRWDGLVSHLASLAPAAFDSDRDLAELAALAARAAGDGGGPPSWWARRRRRRAGRRLARALGADPGTPRTDLVTAIECAADRRARAELEAGGGTVLAPVWARLAEADTAVRLAAGRRAEAAASAEDRRRRGRAAIADLGAALRAGRRQRRRLLRTIDGHRLVAALPLWVGTLRDVEDLLPDTAGLFDLVILDEASQIDQPTAAGALLRAGRAVVVGDPRQLRHVSFVSDDDVARALAAHGLGDRGARVDVRRSSALDLATGVAPTIWLDEHHRSVPHLIAFSARHFYDGRLVVATRHPGNETADAIDVTRPGPEGDVAAALAEVARLAADGRRDIAVVTPFREVADAAQDVLLAAYDVDDVERLGLRVGTVHAFQGAEADHVVLILGLAADDPPGRRRFVEDPHLFNVMVTRARRSLVVVTALPTPAGRPNGLVEEYLIHAARPPRPADDAPCPTPWCEAVARELRALGVTVRTAYPVGHWTVDVCAGDGDGAVGVETTVHPDGPAAHVARHRALGAAGWRLVDGFPTGWGGDAGRAAIDLAAMPTPTDRPPAAGRAR
jgi:hypothetical protein